MKEIKFWIRNNPFENSEHFLPLIGVDTVEVFNGCVECRDEEGRLLCIIAPGKWDSIISQTYLECLSEIKESEDD